MKFRFMMAVVFISLLSFISCKKSSSTDENPKVSILGKWFITRHSSKLYRDTVLLSQSNATVFTINDFTEYFNDGSGVISNYISSSISLELFHYTLSGTMLTQINPGASKGVVETITTLTATNLSIHYQIPLPDPNVFGATDIETDDYDLKR
jgi:hypothetical protein